MKCMEALLIKAVASLFVKHSEKHCRLFFISCTVLIKTLWLSPHSGVSGVEEVWSRHVVVRQLGKREHVDCC